MDRVITEPRRADSIHRAESRHLQIFFQFLHRHTYTLLVVFNLHFPFIYAYFYLVLILILSEKMLQFSKRCHTLSLPHTSFHFTNTFSHYSYITLHQNSHPYILHLSYTYIYTLLTTQSLIKPIPISLLKYT